MACLKCGPIAPTDWPTFDFRTTLGRRADFGDDFRSAPHLNRRNSYKSVLTSFRARLRMAAIRPGRNYSFRTLQNATRSLESRLISNQYLGARVRLEYAAPNYDPQTNRAAITFNVQAGLKVQVDLEGARLSRSTRRRLLPVYQQNGVTPEAIEDGHAEFAKSLPEQTPFRCTGRCGGSGQRH